MNIKSRIPKKFYRLFGSKYLDYYQMILVSLYEESSQSYSLLGLTEEECQDIINEKISSFTMDWSQEQVEDEGELLTRSNMASIMLRRLEDWGWLRKDYDETLNQYVVSFPEYSQLFVDVFVRICSEENSQERESMLSIYTHLFTYRSDKEKNNEILRSALHTTKSLLQMLANMQEGIRGYFDQLSKEKTFLGIQEVLVKEINNTDSKKYAILTTTDSFYRYKEEIKELIHKNLEDVEERKDAFQRKACDLEKESIAWHRNQRGIQSCEEAADLLLLVNREFDAIERRYNRLIDQKRTFAKRAAARIRYILVEGSVEEDRTKALVKLLNTSDKKEEILQKLGAGYGLSRRIALMKEKSFARPKEGWRKEFSPQKVETAHPMSESMDQFVVKPLYTKAELQEFWRKNAVDGVFHATESTVKDMEDLEKLLFIWQEATEVAKNNVEIQIGEEITNEKGLTYSTFTIKRK